MKLSTKGALIIIILSISSLVESIGARRHIFDNFEKKSENDQTKILTEGSEILKTSHFELQKYSL